MPPPDWKSAVEVFPPDWACPGKPFWVAGWIASPTLVPVDIRARLGPRVFLGLCGLPRPDKEIDARGRAGPPHAGFSFLLEPVAGARELRVEVCDQAGRWTEIFRHAVTLPAATREAAPAAPDPLVLIHLLQARYARPASSWPALADEVLAARDATPLDVLPSPPFHGALEEMPAEAPVQYGRLLVTGWLAHRTQRIAGLTAFLDTATPQPLVHGLSRPDAVTLGIELVDGTASRFAGHLELPRQSPHPLCLRIFADLADGRRELVFARRFRPVLISGGDADLPAYSPWTFWRAAWALRRAGLAPGRPWLAAARREYAAAAPRPLKPDCGPAEQPVSPRPLRVIVVTHNLNLEGAPLIAFEFACFLVRQPGWSVRVISTQDGPLREAYAAAGLAVEVLDLKPALAANTVEEFHRQLGNLADERQLGATDVIVANTMVAFWAVLVARQLRKPSLLYTHESVSVRRFFAPYLSPWLIGEAVKAFASATRVVFSAAAAQKVHARDARHDHFRVVPGWIDVAGIQAYAAAHDRAAVRHRLGLPKDAIVLANIGSIAVRKGQHVFIEAIARLQRMRAGGPPLVFLLVGAQPGPDPYGDIVRHAIKSHRLAGVQVVEQVRDAYAYHHASDIFVCSSFEEAFPRVVMEAAVFGRPIVSTDVNGIPEMVGPDEAWLVPPGDPAALAGAMASALAAHLAGDRTRATRARESVAARFAAAVLLPRHLATVCAVANLPVD